MQADLPEGLLWGVRRYLAAANAVITSVHRQPFSGGLSGSTLEYWRLGLRRAGVQSHITLVYKRGAVVEGAFLRGGAQREVQVYAHLAERLPVEIPTVIAFDLAQNDLWLLPFPTSKHTSHWVADWDRTDIANTLADLARLHVTFADAESSLSQLPWLARPTTADVPALLADARRGLAQIQANADYDEALTAGRVKRLALLADDPSSVLTALNGCSPTLLHGDAGFQNIAITADGRQRLWYDWQLAAVGPQALDLATYLHPWAYPEAHPPIPLGEMVAIYLDALARRGRAPAPVVFTRQLDAAFLWRWLIQWAPLLGIYRARLRPEVRQLLYAAFAAWHWPALERWPV